MKQQGHPLFAKLLRLLLEEYCQVETNVPVGDLPRAADIVLVQRTRQETLPFQGLWKNLTTWNVLEFKGPTVSARLGDIDLLVELGLGIDRRLNEQRRKQQLAPVGPEEVSFWYIANHLGRRFLQACEKRLGTLESLSSGVWRCSVLRRMVLLVSSVDLPVEEDSVPLYIAAKAPRDKELAVARLLLQQTPLWQEYGPWLLMLHPELLEEVESMARTVGEQLQIGLKALIKKARTSDVFHIDLDEEIESIIEHYGEEQVVEHILAKLTHAQRQALKRRLR